MLSSCARCNGKKGTLDGEYKVCEPCRVEQRTLRGPKSNLINNPKKAAKMKIARKHGWDKQQLKGHTYTAKYYTAEQRAIIDAEYKAQSSIPGVERPKQRKTWAAAKGEALIALINKAIGKGKSTAGKKTRAGTIIGYERNPTIRKASLNRADGVCEYCEQPARYYKSNGEPLLESHHIDAVSKGGADDVWSVAAIHPDCHAAAHHSAIKKQINTKLREALQSKKLQLLGAN